MSKPKIMILLAVVLVLSGCNTTPDVQITEVSNSSVSYEETIRINNCGGRAESEQTASRSFATNVELGVGVSAGYHSILVGSVSAKYSQYRDATRSQRLVAPPGTNMEFVLRWSEEVRAGNVLVNGQHGTYEVRIPVSVEQISSRDLGCDATEIGQQSSVPAPSVPGQSQEQYLQATIAALQTQVAQPPSSLEAAVPSSTPIVDTPPGSILNAEAHDWWYAGMKGLRPVSVELRAPDTIITEWEVINLSPHTVVINCSQDSFSVSDNLGRRGIVNTWNGSIRALTLNSGERCPLSYSCRFSTQVVFTIDFAQESVTEVVISVSCSGFQNARWRIPVYH